MVPQRRLKANELVAMLAELLNINVAQMAQVANVPRRNLETWLAGKKDNLRLHSIVTLLGLLGIKVEESIRLDEKRVHFWHVHDGLFSGQRAYEAIARLSKLMAGCLMSKVVAGHERFPISRRDYFLVASDVVRVVIVVEKSVLSAPKISPSLIRGACWRDDKQQRSIVAGPRLWKHLVEKDLTVFEFDRIFNQVAETVTWADVSLIAREFGVVPQAVSDWIMERNGDSGGPGSGNRGLDVEGGAPLLALAHPQRKAA